LVPDYVEREKQIVNIVVMSGAFCIKAWTDRLQMIGIEGALCNL
jgi:hypothetical protein